MSVEHASEQAIGAYARGDADLAADEVWALEGHLELCGTCRERLATVVSFQAPAVDSLVNSVWDELEPQLAASPPAPLRRPWSAWLSAWMTPAMVPWLAMAVSVTLAALLLDLAGFRPDLGGEPLVLLVAPVLPVFGVAASWSRGLDPAYELTASAPKAGLYLVLWRTTAVLAVVVPPLLAAESATGATAGRSLLPCLAFTSAALALGSVVGVVRACLALVAVWAAVVLAPTLSSGGMPPALQADSLPFWGLAFALGAAVVVVRRGAYCVLETDR